MKRGELQLISKYYGISMKINVTGKPQLGAKSHRFVCVEKNTTSKKLSNFTSNPMNYMLLANSSINDCMFVSKNLYPSLNLQKDSALILQEQYQISSIIGNTSTTFIDYSLLSSQIESKLSTITPTVYNVISFEI